jgi:predicted methyltransferase
MLLKDFLEENGFSSLEEAKNSGYFHFEDTERDMQVWYLQDLSVEDILDILEEKVRSDYNTWEYIEDIKKWVYTF